MAFNVFEGARRISYVVAGSILLFGLFNTYRSEPFEQVYYTVPMVGEHVEKNVDKNCKEGRMVSFDAKTPSANSVYVHVCFMAYFFESAGRKLVPFKIKGDGFLGDTPYSDNVDNYVEAFKVGFKLPDEDAKEIDGTWWLKWLEAKAKILLYTALFLGGFWIFVLVVGWVVRGFAGIPRGQDHRQKD